jgi:MFS family permease
MKLASLTRAGLGAPYWRLWWANAVDSVGDGAFAAALPLLAVTVTRDPRLISVVSTATYLPWLLVSLPAGTLVDRHDRTTLMWRAQLVQGLVVTAVAVLVALRTIDIAVLAVAGFCLGSAEVVFSNAAQSVLPSLVPREKLPRANGNQYVVQTAGQGFVGPPLGSALFVVAAAAPFGVDAASFAGSAVLLATLPRSRQARRDQARTGVVTGLRWLLRHRLLRVVAVLLGANNFFGQMGYATIVLLATGVLHVSTRGYGLLLVGAAVGSVVGGLVNPAITRRAGQVPSLVIASAANACIYVGVGLAPNPVVLGVLLACNGFTVTMWNVVTVSLRQTIVPDDLLGRVNGAYRMLGWGMMPLGALAGGFVAHLAGLRAPFTVAGILRGAVLVLLLPALLAASRSREKGGSRESAPAVREI